eukprot:3058568-Rhodomonas_salina.1
MYAPKHSLSKDRNRPPKVLSQSPSIHKSGADIGWRVPTRSGRPSSRLLHRYVEVPRATYDGPGPSQLPASVSERLASAFGF